MGRNGWALAVAGVGSCLVIAAACAGGDTPPRDAALEEKIRSTYDPDYKTGAAGSVSMGTGGSSSGTGGRASGGASGSANSGTAGSGTAGSGTAGSGTSGSGSTGGAVCDAPTKVLSYYCGLGSGCHGPGAALGDFGVDEAAALALVDKSTKNAACGKYIDSANPEQSAILLKLGASPPCGAQMPFGSKPLGQDDIDCLTSWLDSL